ncbi:MAG: hypothetical protein AB7L41_00500 [Flavobacteriaceae bacterium]
MQRILKSIAWPYAIAYVAMWAAFVWFARDGALIRANPACHAIETAPLPLWTCTEGGLPTLAVLFIDFVLIVTVWAPAIVAAATVNTAALTVAVPLVLGHFAGLAATVYAMLRIFGWIVGNTVGRLMSRAAA